MVCGTVDLYIELTFHEHTDKGKKAMRYGLWTVDCGLPANSQ